MLFKPGTALYAYEIVKETGIQVMYANFLGAPFVPNLVNADVMERTIDLIIKAPKISRIVFVPLKCSFRTHPQQILRTG